MVCLHSGIEKTFLAVIDEIAFAAETRDFIIIGVVEFSHASGVKYQLVVRVCADSMERAYMFAGQNGTVGRKIGPDREGGYR